MAHAAKGVDTLGEQWANINSVAVKRFPADWNKYGRGAGPVRNRQMSEYGDALIAIWDGKSRGTENMIEEARKRNLRIFIFIVP